MPKQRTTPDGLPLLPRMYLKHGKFYFVSVANKWHNLGKEYYTALEEYAKLNRDRATAGSLAVVFDRYEENVLPGKALKTVKEQTRQLKRLREVFGKVAPEDLRPGHIYKYLEKRPPYAGNREKALLSHVFNMAIRWEYILTNPCVGVKGSSEKPNTRLVTPTEYIAMWQASPKPIRDAMDLAYMTGFRQGDILSLNYFKHWKTDGLLIETAKTGKVLLARRTPELEYLVAQCMQTVEPPKKTKKSYITPSFLVHSDCGYPYSSSGFQSQWRRWMNTCVNNTGIKKFQFKDIRAMAGTAAGDDKFLGHDNPEVFRKHYERGAYKIEPNKLLRSKKKK